MTAPINTSVLTFDITSLPHHHHLSSLIAENSHSLTGHPPLSPRSAALGRDPIRSTDARKAGGGIKGTRMFRRRGASALATLGDGFSVCRMRYRFTDLAKSTVLIRSSDERGSRGDLGRDALGCLAPAASSSFGGVFPSLDGHVECMAFVAKSTRHSMPASHNVSLLASRGIVQDTKTRTPIPCHDCHKRR